MRHSLLLVIALLQLGAGGCCGQTPQLRVLTYNIRHGEGSDGKIDLERLARVIVDSDADLVALQEVDVGVDRTGGVDQASVLARLTGLHADFAAAITFQGGQYGLAVLSRWPLTDPGRYELPGDPRDEPRIAQVVHVRPWRHRPPVRFVNTHLHYARDTPSRAAQIHRLHELFVNDDPIPTVLAGDLNTRPDEAEMQLMFDHWLDAGGANPQPTIPADAPTARIDYILARPAARWRVVHAEVIDEPVASDHRPVLVVLELID
jgi:endonuclease/exonuclease/phosphatase family metal-dependent hydrolase